MKKTTTLLLFLIGTMTLSAQYFDVGLLGGVSNYQGDLAPSDIWNSVGQSHAVIGAFGRYNFNNVFAARASLAKGTISGSDYDTADKARRTRNLHFESALTEFSLIGEINLFGYTPSNLHSDFSPYLFAGIALFHFNPQTEYLERWVELQPLGTEGQGMSGYAPKYKRTQLSVPFGGGIKKNLNQEWTIALEVGLRKTFTDYLDDVSGFYVNFNELLLANGSEAAALGDRRGEYLGNGEPIIEQSGVRKRGNPDNKDWYLFTNLTVSYNFVFKGIYTSSANSRHLGCPRRF